MQDLVIAWFKANARELPWRSHPDPWWVMVSEFMLQQTPVARVLPVFDEWIRRWPTIREFAAAPSADVLRAWGRLGYPRRALRLHEAAKAIVNNHGGEIPADINQLRALPGIGEYTAAAISSFAFGQDHVVLDTNVRRVLVRVIGGIDTPAGHITNAERAEAAALIPPGKGSLWAAASMELGALICRPKPSCEQCPLALQCAWRAAGYPESEQKRTRTQAWDGTDRQARGRIMALLRANHQAVQRSQIDAVWPDGDQRERALLGLLSDGLVQEIKPGWFAFPQS